MMASPSPQRLAEELNLALHALLEDTPEVVILGEDLHDPVGGAFRVTAGLSTRFPDRVISTPISEAAIVGVAAGLAMRGYRVIAEIMFGDFLMLAADQLINGATKFRSLYDTRLCVPMVVRTPMGGRRGYGATHSQCLEKHFLGVHGLLMAAMSPVHDNGAILTSLVREGEGPSLFIENKTLYTRAPMATGGTDFWRRDMLGGPLAPVRMSIRGIDAPSVTLMSYGGQAEICLCAAEQMAVEQEVFCEVVVLAQLSPLDRTMLRALPLSRRIVVAEEGTLTGGVGAELVASLVAGASGVVAERVAATDTVIPCARSLEEQVLPGVDALKDAVTRIAR